MCLDVKLTTVGVMAPPSFDRTTTPTVVSLFLQNGAPGSWQHVCPLVPVHRLVDLLPYFSRLHDPALVSLGFHTDDFGLFPVHDVLLLLCSAPSCCGWFWIFPVVPCLLLFSNVFFFFFWSKIITFSTSSADSTLESSVTLAVNSTEKIFKLIIFHHQADKKKFSSITVDTAALDTVKEVVETHCTWG